MGSGGGLWAGLFRLAGRGSRPDNLSRPHFPACVPRSRSCSCARARAFVCWWVGRKRGRQPLGKAYSPPQGVRGARPPGGVRAAVRVRALVFVRSWRGFFGGATPGGVRAAMLPCARCVHWDAVARDDATALAVLGQIWLLGGTAGGGWLTIPRI